MIRKNESIKNTMRLDWWVCNEPKNEEWDQYFNLLTQMGVQDRISPYNINTMLSRQVMRIKKNITKWRNCYLIQSQILQTNIIRIVWQTVGRISNEILGAKGLKREN